MTSVTPQISRTKSPEMSIRSASPTSSASSTGTSPSSASMPAPVAVRPIEVRYLSSSTIQPYDLDYPQMSSDYLANGLMSIATFDEPCPLNATPQETCEAMVDLNKISFFQKDAAMFTEKPYLHNGCVVPKSWDGYCNQGPEPPIYNYDLVNVEWPKEACHPDQAREYYNNSEVSKRPSSDVDPPVREQLFLAKEGITEIPLRPAIRPQIHVSPKPFRIAPQYLRQNNSEWELPSAAQIDTDAVGYEEQDRFVHWNNMNRFLYDLGPSVYDDENSHFGKLWKAAGEEAQQCLREEWLEGAAREQARWQEWEDYVRPLYREWEMTEQELKDQRHAKFQRVTMALLELEDALKETRGPSVDGIKINNEEVIVDILSGRVEQVSQDLRKMKALYSIDATTQPTEDSPPTAIAASEDHTDAESISTDHSSTSDSSHLTSAIEDKRHDSAHTSRDVSPELFEANMAPTVDITATLSPSPEATIDLVDFGSIAISSTIKTRSYKLSDRCSDKEAKASYRVSAFINEVAASFDTDSVVSDGGYHVAFRTPLVKVTAQSSAMTEANSSKLKDRMRAKLHRFHEKISFRKH